MRLTCPSCGAVHSAESWSNDAAARRCLVVAAGLPAEVARRALTYLALFRSPGSKRGLSWNKALRLLHSLEQMVTADHIQWDRLPARPNAHVAWSQALEQLIQRPPSRLPLTSHGYLKKVAYDIADDLDKSAERRFIEQERDGTLGQQDEPRWTPGPDDFTRLRNAVKGVGRKI